MSKDSFGTRATLSVAGKNYTIYRIQALEKRGFKLAQMPYSLRVMLENVLRREDGRSVTAEQVELLVSGSGVGSGEFSFMPARVLLQDFTGVPVVADLAAMGDAVRRLGGDPAKINPLQQTDLVIDHSVQVDSYGLPTSLAINARMEFERNQERDLFF